ncbi:MAG: alpha/beta hydrolase [Cyanothece sp. SIO1E1]|nr:alpha/beta hydrolase [Cyanothece sp. SIO1E1]
MILQTIGWITLSVPLTTALTLGSIYWLSGRRRPSLTEQARHQLLTEQVAFAFVKLSHGVTHYRLEGPQDQPTFVFVHGVTNLAYTWHGYVDSLTRAGYQVLTFNLFGWGFSDRPGGRYDDAFFARQILELLDALELHQPVHIVGNSLGGAIAAAFTARHRNRIQSLTIIAPAMVDQHNKPNWYFTAPIIGDWIFRVLGLALLEQRFLQGVDPDDPHIPIFRQHFRTQAKFAGYEDSLLRTARDFPLDAMEPIYRSLAQIKNIPIHLVWAQDDRVSPYRFAALIKRLTPNVQLHVLETGGHGIVNSQQDFIQSILLNISVEVM